MKFKLIIIKYLGCLFIAFGGVPPQKYCAKIYYLIESLK